MKWKHRDAKCFLIPLLCIAFSACTWAPAKIVLTDTALFLRDSLARGAQAMCHTDFLVLENKRPVYSMPSIESKVKGTLSEGEKVEVLSAEAGWVLCISDQHEIGWIQMKKGKPE